MPSSYANLAKSPKELGMSRADLWAFAGVAALSFYDEFTKQQCSKFGDELTCGAEESCHIQVPNWLIPKMFKTGRQDCIPRQGASLKNQYLASKIESHPHNGFNGKKTVEYFEKHFNMKGKEALALMGAHTIGGFNQVTSNIDYAWVRDGFNKFYNGTWLLNNDYYKVMTRQPNWVKPYFCIGDMAGQKATTQFRVMSNVFPMVYDPPNPWSTKDRPGQLSWMEFRTRGPNCQETEMGEENDQNMFYGPTSKAARAAAKAGWTGTALDWCCKQKEDGCAAKGTCDPACTITAQNRIRHLGSDVGFFLKWDIDDNGVPYGCGELFGAKGERTEQYYRETEIEL